jgi:peptidyl-prolyl cis-trans isomerase A (cyclophilin A)
VIHRPALAVLLALLVTGCGAERAPDAQGSAPVAPATVKQAVPAPPPAPLPDSVRVRLETDVGAIVVALDAKRAPITATNFVRYAEGGRFDGASFYRAAVSKNSDGEPVAGRGFIQGGIRRNYRLMLAPIAHEPTSRTGLRHEAGTISMARSAETGVGAMGEFFILTAAMPAMDAKGDKEGYAAFGKVVEGMDVVQSILTAPTIANAGRGAMRGQMLEKPVRILRARRVE